MPFIQPRPQPGPPINAASTDGNVAAVDGAFLAPLEPTPQLGAGIGVVGSSGSGIGVQVTSDSGVALQATSNSQDAIQGKSSSSNKLLVVDRLEEASSAVSLRLI